MSSTPHPPNAVHATLASADPIFVASRLAAIVPLVEAALEDGSVDRQLEDAEVREVLGDTLIGRYRTIAAERLRHDVPFRQKWVAAFLDTLQSSLRQPAKTFSASEWVPAGKCSGWRPSQNSLPPLQVRHFQGDVILRPDQVIAARRWGIWFDFDDARLGRAYSEHLVTKVRNRLASNIKHLWSIEGMHMAGRLKLAPEAKWGADHIGGRFERLVVDVLNEHAFHAEPASLAEDVLEWTDLRLHHPSVGRKEGARVQVSLVAHPEHHQRKIGKVFLPAEFVFITSMDLAKCALAPPDSEPFAEFEWTGFWASLGATYSDAVALADQIHRIFLEALWERPSSPLGPMWMVPVWLRAFIRAFAEHYATEAGEHVRERLKAGLGGLTSVDRFSGTYGKAQFADQPENGTADPVSLPVESPREE